MRSARVRAANQQPGASRGSSLTRQLGHLSATNISAWRVAPSHGQIPLSRSPESGVRASADVFDQHRFAEARIAGTLACPIFATTERSSYTSRTLHRIGESQTHSLGALALLVRRVYPLQPYSPPQKLRYGFESQRKIVRSKPLVQTLHALQIRFHHPTRTPPHRLPKVA